MGQRKPRAQTGWKSNKSQGGSYKGCTILVLPELRNEVKCKAAAIFQKLNVKDDLANPSNMKWLQISLEKFKGRGGRVVLQGTALSDGEKTET